MKRLFCEFAGVQKSNNLSVSDEEEGENHQKDRVSNFRLGN